MVALSSRERATILSGFDNEVERLCYNAHQGAERLNGFVIMQ